MAANATIAQRVEAGRAHSMSYPLYFPPVEPGLFAWLHAPHGTENPEVGLLICKPFGYEAICAHRSLRAFAEMAAAVGIPVLRFDYLGTGDSADCDPQAEQLGQWCNDIITAIEELRRRTGVKRVCLLGFRLGALLATLVAQRCNAVDFLILVAPVVSGRRYASELRTTSLAAAVSSNARHGTRPTSGDGSIEVSGHCASSATIAHLSQIDLATSGVPGVSRLLVIDRDDLPTARKWVESLAATGLAVEYRVLPGFVKAMMTPPPYTSIPRDMIAAAREWLLRLCSSSSEAAPAPESLPVSSDFAVPASALLSIRDRSESSNAAFIERPAQFGDEAKLFGIVTEPAKGENRHRAVILVNAGADYHIAIGRMYVSLARCWARRGYVVLRMDLAGLGDSGTRLHRPDNEVFPPAAVADIRSAVNFMRERYRAGDITVAGLCSGAYHALRAATSAVPLNRILMVNPETFRWGESMTLEDIDPAAVVRTGSVYRDKVRSWKHWKKLLTGKADAWWITKRLSLRITLSLGVTMRGVLRFLNIPLRDDLGRELQRIASRGIQTTMVFSRGEPGIALLEMQAGSAIHRLGDHFHMHIIDNADHTFSRSESRSELQEVLSGELFRQSGVA
jgi:alpha-beta hydrolase superfamily lysophospholipase